MIVRILSRGKSFKGLAAYLTHDAKAETNERVAWTHTLNLANDHVPSAIDEMVWTARQAELLKQEAGIRAGGRATANAVKHLSLNWHPDEEPTRDHMIETAEGFLKHMGWQEHQALLVVHDDRAHPHVHLMLNVVHPETGLRLDDNFERRRAQAWAAAYEREQDRIYCEQRQLPPEEREDAPTRPAWMAFKEKEREFAQAEKSRAENQINTADETNIPENSSAAEWKRLKEIQKQQRLAFLAEGKSAFSELRAEIYRSIRSDYRGEWASYFEAKKNGGDADELAALKAELVAEQASVLAERRDAACKELKLSRDADYRELLEFQRDIRSGLRARQEAGFENDLYLQLAERGPAREEAFEIAGESEPALLPANDNQRPANGKGHDGEGREDRAGVRAGGDVGAGVAQGIGFGLISLFESVADGFVGAKPEARRRQPEPERIERNPFDAVIEEARVRQRREQEEADEAWRKRQRSVGE